MKTAFFLPPPKTDDPAFHPMEIRSIKYLCGSPIFSTRFPGNSSRFYFLSFMGGNKETFGDAFVAHLPGPTEVFVLRTSTLSLQQNILPRCWLPGGFARRISISLFGSNFGIEQDLFCDRFTRVKFYVTWIQLVPLNPDTNFFAPQFHSHVFVGFLFVVRNVNHNGLHLRTW